MAKMSGDGCCVGGLAIVGHVDNLGMDRFAEKVEDYARMSCQIDRRFFADFDIFLKIVK